MNLPQLSCAVDHINQEAKDPSHGGLVHISLSRQAKWPESPIWDQNQGQKSTKGGGQGCPGSHLPGVP